MILNFYDTIRFPIKYQYFVSYRVYILNHNDMVFKLFQYNTFSHSISESGIVQVRFPSYKSTYRLGSAFLRSVGIEDLDIIERRGFRVPRSMILQVLLPRRGKATDVTLVTLLPWDKE